MQKFPNSFTGLIQGLVICVHASSQSFHEPYFIIKLIFHESYRVNRIQSFVNIIFYGTENIQIFFYYLIYSGARKAFQRIMQQKEDQLEMYHFKELP